LLPIAVAAQDSHPATATSQNLTRTFEAASPWFDVTNSTYGAHCDGRNDDTSAIQAALTAANRNGGGTVFLPAGKTCVVSSLSMNGFIGVTLRGGWGTAALANNVQSTLEFTDTCSKAACLRMLRSQATSVYNLQLKFPNATAGPMIDMTGSAVEGLYGNTFVGPGNSAGPILLDQATNNIFLIQNNWSAASIYIEGPAGNSAIFSDDTIIEKNNFNPAPGSMAIANPSVGWTITHNTFQLYTGANTCVPAIANVNNFTNQQSLLIQGNEFLVAGPCTLPVSLIVIPAASANYGGVTVISNLFIGGTSASKQNLLSIGANQSAFVSGNNFQFAWNGVGVDSGVQLTLGANQWHTVSNFLSGTPTSGCVTSPTNTTSCYGSLATVAPPVAAGPLPTLTGTGACSTIRAQKGGSWSGQVTCTGPTGPSSIVIAPGSSAPNALQCHGSDATNAIAGAQSGISATTCTLSFPTVTSGDTITFALTSY
jgi:hypothetical protein